MESSGTAWSWGWVGHKIVLLGFSAAGRNLTRSVLVVLLALLFPMGLQALAQAVERTDESIVDDHSVRHATDWADHLSRINERLAKDLARIQEELDEATKRMQEKSNEDLKRLKEKLTEDRKRSQEKLAEDLKHSQEKLDEDLKRSQETWAEDRKRSQEQQDKDWKDWRDSLSKRVEKKLARERKQATRDEYLGFVASFFGALVVYLCLLQLLTKRVRKPILHIHIPTVARRWGSFCKIGSFVALALAPVAFFLNPLEWVPWFVSAPAYFRIAGYVFPIGFCIALSGFLCNAGLLCRQRTYDLLSEALLAKLSTSSKADDPFILYLRPFVSTGAVTTPMRMELEEQLSAAVRPFGRFVALGSSLEKEVGFEPGSDIVAGRIKCTDAHWQEAVRHLMREALLIVIVASSRPGTRWEIEHVLAEYYITKTVFIDVPNTSFRFAQEWDEIGRLLWSRGYQWPADDPRGQFVYFGALKTPLTLSLGDDFTRLITLARYAATSEARDLTTRQTADTQPDGTTAVLAAHSDLRTAQQWFEQRLNSHDPDEELRCYGKAFRLTKRLPKPILVIHIPTVAKHCWGRFRKIGSFVALALAPGFFTRVLSARECKSRQGGRC
jgi:hypothetical protein